MNYQIEIKGKKITLFVKTKITCHIICFEWIL